jgi:integrase
LIRSKIKEYKGICDSIPGVEFKTVHEVVEILETPQQKEQEIFKLDIISHLMTEYERLLALGRKKKKTAGSRQTVANSLKSYCRRDSLDVNELNTKFVEGYIDFLRDGNEKYTRKCSQYPSVISKVLNDLKAVHNDEEAGITKITVNPFEKIKQRRKSGINNRPFVKPKKRLALSVEQIQSIINLKTFDSKREELARDIYLLSFMLMGMNAVDLLTCSDYSNGILTYCRQKVEDSRGDDAEIQIKIEPEMRSLFEKYKNLNRTKNTVFHFSTKYADNDNFCDAINKGLQIIGKRIGVKDLKLFTSYSTRRSYATIACNVVEVGMNTVSELLNHADGGGAKVTKLYVDKDYSRLWRINRKVLDLFDWSGINCIHELKTNK